MSNFIKLSNLSKSFNDTKKVNVLKKISYNFKKGKIYSLIGPSGSCTSLLSICISLFENASDISLVPTEP